MSRYNPPFAGDSEFSIACATNIEKGDAIRFSKAVFVGKYPRGEFAGYELVTGVVKWVNEEWMGVEKLDEPMAAIMKVKLSSLVRTGCFRRRREDEGRHEQAKAERNEEIEEMFRKW